MHVGGRRLQTKEKNKGIASRSSLDAQHAGRLDVTIHAVPQYAEHFVMSQPLASGATRFWVKRRATHKTKTTRARALHATCEK